MTEGKVVDWLKQQGQSFAQGEELLEIETTKITNVFEASDSGTLRRIVAPAGTTLPVGALLAVAAPEEVPDSDIDAINIHSARKRMGRQLALESFVDADVGRPVVALEIQLRVACPVLPREVEPELIERALLQVAIHESRAVVGCELLRSPVPDVGRNVAAEGVAWVEEDLTDCPGSYCCERNGGRERAGVRVVIDIAVRLRADIDVTRVEPASAEGGSQHHLPD